MIDIIITSDIPKVKRCVTCGRFFGRPKDVKGKAWANRKFCSNACQRFPKTEYRCIDCGVIVVSNRRGLRCYVCRIPHNKAVIEEWHKNNPERSLQIRKLSVERTRNASNRRKRQRRREDEEYRNRIKENSRRYKQKEGVRIREKLYQSKRIESGVAAAVAKKIYYRKHEHYKMKSREYANRQKQELRDCYVKQNLKASYGFDNDGITPDLIEAQRALILAHRALCDRGKST